MAVFLLLLALTGCSSGIKAAFGIVSPRDAAIQKSVAWEKKRYEDILNQSEIPVYGFKIIREIDHDETAFTEGLVMDQHFLYESCGLWDQSRLTAINLRTGREERRHDLAPLYFGEGITVLGDEIFQLTYQSYVGFVYQKDNFQLRRTFRLPHQGWGLTNDGAQLIMTDGAAALIFLDPKSLCCYPVCRRE